MDNKGIRKSWTISDELREKVKDEIPAVKGRDPQRKYQNRPGQGRKRLDSRKVLSGIFYVLRTGCQWKAVPAEFGSGSSLHRYFQEWEKAGFFRKIWAIALEEYDDLKGIGWEWQSVDGSMVKAPLAQSATGPNPTDRGKNGNKTKRIVRRTRSSTGNCSGRGKST